MGERIGRMTKNRINGARSHRPDVKDAWSQRSDFSAYKHPYLGVSKASNEIVL